MTGEQMLCNAIIIQAAKDFRAASRKLKKHPDDPGAQAELRKLEVFFRSDWFKVLSGASGEQILSRLRKEAA